MAMEELVLFSWLVVAVLVSVGIGLVLGQHSVWRHLRKGRKIKIEDWTYSASKRERKTEMNLKIHFINKPSFIVRNAEIDEEGRMVKEYNKPMLPTVIIPFENIQFIEIM